MFQSRVATAIYRPNYLKKDCMIKENKIIRLKGVEKFIFILD